MCLRDSHEQVPYGAFTVTCKEQVASVTGSGDQNFDLDNNLVADGAGPWFESYVENSDKIASLDVAVVPPPRGGFPWFPLKLDEVRQPVKVATPWIRHAVTSSM